MAGVPFTRAGDIRDYAWLMRPTKTVSDVGVPEQSLVKAYELWVRIEPISAREAPIAERMQEDITHKITFRSYDAEAVDSQMVFLVDDIKYHIIGTWPLDNIKSVSVAMCKQEVKTG